jgi:hypothetical protein
MAHHQEADSPKEVHRVEALHVLHHPEEEALREEAIREIEEAVTEAEDSTAMTGEETTAAVRIAREEAATAPIEEETIMMTEAVVTLS